jgi:hypothetical protein
VTANQANSFSQRITGPRTTAAEIAADLERRQKLDWIPGYGPSNGSRTRRIGN